MSAPLQRHAQVEQMTAAVHDGEDYVEVESGDEVDESIVFPTRETQTYKVAMAMVDLGAAEYHRRTLGGRPPKVDGRRNNNQSYRAAGAQVLDMDWWLDPGIAFNVQRERMVHEGSLRRKRALICPHKIPRRRENV